MRCPRCGSNRVLYIYGKGKIFIAGLVVVFASVSMTFLTILMIPIFSLFILPFVLLGLGIMIYSAFVKKTARCSACNKIFKIPIQFS